MDNDNIDITIAYYLRDEWDAWRNTVEDGELTFRGSYEDWQEIVEQVAAEKRAEGYEVHLVKVRLSEFLKWAEEKGTGTNAQARATYSGMLLQVNK
jgi:hypothetical protein